MRTDTGKPAHDICQESSNRLCPPFWCFVGLLNHKPTEKPTPYCVRVTVLFTQNAGQNWKQTNRYISWYIFMRWSTTKIIKITTRQAMHIV
jgi:hypothetical protein